MISRELVIEFLEGLQWQRMTRNELQRKLQEFFKTDNSHKLVDFTCEDCKEIDYSFGFTTGDSCNVRSFIDIEIFYLKARQRGHFIITGVQLLDYVE